MKILCENLNKNFYLILNLCSSINTTTLQAIKENNKKSDITISIYYKSNWLNVCNINIKQDNTELYTFDIKISMKYICINIGFVYVLYIQIHIIQIKKLFYFIFLLLSL